MAVLDLSCLCIASKIGSLGRVDAILTVYLCLQANCCLAKRLERGEDVKRVRAMRFMSAAVSYACRNKLGVPDVGIRMKAVAGSKYMAIVYGPVSSSWHCFHR